MHTHESISAELRFKCVVQIDLVHTKVFMPSSKQPFLVAMTPYEGALWHFQQQVKLHNNSETLFIHTLCTSLMHSQQIRSIAFMRLIWTAINSYLLRMYQLPAQYIGENSLLHALTSRLAANCLSRVAIKAMSYETSEEGMPENIERTRIKVNVCKKHTHGGYLAW